MEFKPRAPREGINVSKTHPLKEAATLIVGLIAVFVGLVFLAAWSVDLAVRFISPQAEAQAFESLGIDPLIQKAMTAADARHDDLQEVVDKLASHWEDAAYNFQVFVMESDDPNAAALPGGYILVTSALLDGVENENELAFVLGHELGHYHGRDHLRRLGRGMVYGLALSLIFGQASSVPDIGTLTGDLTSRGFDRDQESAADRFGLSLVQAEYGHIGSSWRFFERLTEEGSEINGLAAYLSTHPGNTSRIDDMMEHAKEQGWPTDGPVEPF